MKVIFALLLMWFSTLSYAVEQAEEIFKQLAPSLYQIRLIDKASGEKSSIGSGFQISSDGLIATNYHVISGFARHPHKYNIEYLDNQGNKAALSLKSVDVINDLAIVQREVSSAMPFFEIAKIAPTKGEELYSLGNPHDLGMIVVPGTYNGLKNESFNDRIHFTGSVNSGMSGGPVVNKETQVVGVNVATSGNQIGFLVPHDKLLALYQEYKNTPPASIETQMTAQLIRNQEKLINTVLNSDWQLKKLGRGLIPTIDVPYIRCWGESNSDKADAQIMAAVANCDLDENTYISSDFFTGSLEMEYRYMESNKIGSTKFYHIFERQLNQVAPGNKAGKDDVTEYQCHHDIVMPTQSNINSKAVFCTRAYKAFPELFDVIYIGISIDHEQYALLSHFTISGVAQETSLAFLTKFMESVKWN